MSLVVIELENFSVASNPFLSLIDIVLRFGRSSLSVLILKISDISNGIDITKFLEGN